MDGDGPPRPGRAHGVVAPVRTDPSGTRGPTRGQAARTWRRSSHGFYVPADVVDSPAQRVVEAAVLVPTGSAVTGWAALCWRGSRWADGTGPDGARLPVDVVGLGRIRAQQPIRVREERIEPAEVDVLDGVPVAAAAHAACFTARYAASPAAAVEALCMAYSDDLVDPEEVRSWLLANAGRPGIRQARAAWAMADENLWSPREVHVMLRWEDLRGTRPLTNRPLFDLDDRHLGTPDLLDPVAGVAGEYEGEVHLDRRRRRGDLRKEQRLRDAGLEVFAVVADDLRRAGVLEQRISAAYARAARSRTGERGWTLDRPAWWEATHTVALRRALPAGLREVWLPHLAAAARARDGR